MKILTTTRYNWMTSMLVVLCALCASQQAWAQMGTWHAYMSYYEPQQIVKASDNLFVRASNSLYRYNMTDHSITTFDKVRQLNDTHVTMIAWSQQAKRLIVVYENSNIDLLDLNDNVTNISALYLKSMTKDKTINAIYIHHQYAYLATGFGVMKVNMERAEVDESYILDENITDIGISNNTIYLRNKSGKVLSAQLAQNLIDPHNWAEDMAPDGIFNQDLTDWDEYKMMVSTLNPDGPKTNHFGFMTYRNGKLYACSGPSRPGCIQVKDGNNNWQVYQDTDLTAITNLKTYVNVVALAVDPNDSEHVFAAARNGLYEFQNGQLVGHYAHNNSPIGMYLNQHEEYQIMTGVLCDNQNNLWCLNSTSATASLLKMNLGTGEWTAADIPELMRLTASNMTHSLANMINLHFDQQGCLWFINDNYQLDSFYCIDPTTMKLVNYFESFVNQDGITIADYRPHCLTEDIDGNLWIGTKSGPFMLEKANLYTRDTYLTQVKVPRNDGSDYADYLLSGANISCMAIDGGNRKWFGTNGAGVYLISADNMQQLHYFTTDNSPLLSNNIESITIDHTTGEVFFGTDQGLCSFMSDATQPTAEMNSDQVYAYPNPVLSDYNGLITVVGLSMNADVKILTVNGQLVAEGRSNGGTFTWNGCDRRGRRVASGVYMVAAATSDGQKGVVCKIAIVN